MLAVAAGQSYTAAARTTGRRSCDAVAISSHGFNRDGVAAVEPRRGGGRQAVYTTAERERILAEGCRLLRPAGDGTAT